MKQKTKELIREWAPAIHNAFDPEALLHAVYYCEHYTRDVNVPHFESAFAPDGYYYKRSSFVRQEYEKWGSAAACSYSNFQILFISARELGYDGPPHALDKDSVAIPYVVKFINERILAKGAKTLEDIADAYNSGTHRDRYVPERYIQRFVRAYKEALSQLKEERDAVTV